MESESIVTTPKPFIFVLMPFSTKFNDIYKFGIKGAADDIGAYAERVDEQNYIESILERIYNQINKADVIVADMTGQNSNVFYEVGYAHALGKIVLLLTQNADDIPFDLKHKPHTVYGGDISSLREQLGPKLTWAITESKRRGNTLANEQFGVSISGLAIESGTSPESSPIISSVIKMRRILDSDKLSILTRVITHRVYVRNNAKLVSETIRHIYLFSEPDSPLQPCNKTKSTVNGRVFRGTDLIDSFKAAPTDSVDGLCVQYRLDCTLNSLPPGAVDSFEITFQFSGFKDDLAEVTSFFRLRFYSESNSHDFTFRLKAIMQMPASKKTES